MEKYESSIWDASFKTGLSHIQLWILIRNNLVDIFIIDDEVRVNINSLRHWIGSHRALFNQLQIDVDMRDNPDSFNKYLKRIRRKRDCNEL